jgi:hypothetical protein
MNLLNNDESEKLLASGFTLWEVNEFSNAKTPEGNDQPEINLNNKVWTKAITDRQKFYNNLMSQGWTYQQYEQAIYEQYNKDERQSPWDFLKTAYKPPQKPEFKSTIEATARVRDFKSNVRRDLRQTKHKLSKEEGEFFEGTLGETIKRLNRNR